MSIGHWFATAVLFALLLTVTAASRQGWGLTSDATALARARAQPGSVRSGSLHHRYFFGGGPGFGK